jgi:hypothetical protein
MSNPGTEMATPEAATGAPGMSNTANVRVRAAHATSENEARTVMRRIPNNVSIVTTTQPSIFGETT